MKYPRILLSLLFFSLLTSCFSFAQEHIVIPVTQFNPEHLNKIDYENPKWSRLELPNREGTKYELVEIDNRFAIKAKSNNSASGLIYKVDIDPLEYPIIEWSWKVDKVLEEGNYKFKKGDDYPARIYITFDFDKMNLGVIDRIKYAAIRTFTKYKIPLRAINYIWANKADVGTIAPNAYTNWVYMIAVESGDNNSKEWKIEVQNIYEDYQKAFEEVPPRINGIAIMTDTDNTEGIATAYYGDIIFKKSAE